MKKHLIKILFLIILSNFSALSYSYNVFGKPEKPTNNSETENNEDTYDKTKNIEKAEQVLKKVNNSAGSIIIDDFSYTAKGQNNRERFIIIHYTATNKDISLSTLTNDEVSSHFLVTDDKNDPVYALVPENKRAWHAGLSEWKNTKNLNDSSLGIEIVNNGDSSGIFESYKSFQIKNVAVLVKYLAEKYGIPETQILGHSDIAPQRKSDPGPLFPWKELYTKYKIGMWYDEERKKAYEFEFESKFEDLSISDIQKEFKKFGYAIEITNKWDKQTQNVVKVFQHHFRPKKYDGKVDLETYSILKALNEKYNNN